MAQNDKTKRRPDSIPVVVTGAVHPRSDESAREANVNNRNVIVSGVSMSRDAAERVAEVGCDVRLDVWQLQRGIIDEDELRAECTNGASEDRVGGWNEYVDAVVNHARRDMNATAA